MAELARVARAVAVAAQGPAAGLLDRLCAACAHTMPVEGAAISVMADVGHPMARSDSNPMVSRLEELQFTLGEGPGVAAFLRRAPAFLEDLLATDGSWPVFAAEAAALVSDTGGQIRSMVAVPLGLGRGAPLGVLDLYQRRHGEPDADFVSQARIAVDAVALALFSVTVADTDEQQDHSWLQYALGSQAEVDQAVGMVMAQTNLRSDESLARIRAHAFVHGQSVDEVAEAIVSRELRFPQERW